MVTRLEQVPLQEKRISATSTPRRVLLSHGRQTTTDSPNGHIHVAKENPTPNYLKPTVSSSHDTSCRYPKSQQHHAEDSMAAAGAMKRLISMKSMGKPALHLSPKAALSAKIVPEKSSKVPTRGKILTRAKSHPMRLPKRREANGTPSTTSAIKQEQEEKVIFIDIEVQGHAARHGSHSLKSNEEGKHCTDSEERDNGKPRAPRGQLSKKVRGSDGALKKLKFQRGTELEGDGMEAVLERLKFKQRKRRMEVGGEGNAEQENVVLKRLEVNEKHAQPAYNDVIEETASNLANRRGKVKALVGAFESVISLQEPKSQTSQRQEEVVVKLGRVGQPAQGKIREEGIERGHTGRVKPEKKVKVAGEDAYGRGPPDQHQPHDE